jgi:drug/metabolite transporter (DMT)-like permease
LIDYILILLAVACFAAQFAFTKLYEGRVGQSGITTLVMLSGASFVGTLIFFLAEGGRIQFSAVSLIWGIVFALIMLPYYMIGIKVLSLGSLAIYSMFMMLGGMLVPFFYGVLFLHERISIGKGLGTVLLVVFIVLQAVWQSESEVGKKAGDSKMRSLFISLCLVIFFINGMTGVIAKAHSISEGAVSEGSFTVIYCALTSLMSFLILLFSLLKNRREKMLAIKKALQIKPLSVMVLLGAAAYGGNYLQLLAADSVPASVQFPLVSGGVIVLSALVSAVCFKDKISKKEWISVAGAFVSTFLFAF